MKNQREIYEALLAGETLKLGNQTLKLDEEKGILVVKGEGDISYIFSTPDEYEIYKEPKWYENIPEGGVLCWIGDNDNSVSVGLVIDYDPESKYNFTYASHCRNFKR